MTPEQLRSSILQYAIEGKLVEQRSEEGTAEELYQQIQEEKHQLIKEGKIKKEKELPEITEDEIPFDIPDSWKWVRLGKIISVASGKGLTKKEMNDSGIYPVYGGNGITGYHNEYNVSEKTLVIGRVGFYCGSVHITEDNAWVTDNAFIVDYNKKYIYISWLKHLIDNLKLGKQTSATAQPVISGKKIYPRLIPLPPLEEQKRIVAKIEELEPFIEKYGKAWNELEALNKKFPGDMKNSILQYAIEGKLVEQRPEEGTAEELYQKIQEEKQKLIKEGKIKEEKALPEIKEYEKPFDIPDSWKWVKLGTVISLLSGRDLSPSEYNDKSLGVPYITGASNIEKDSLIINRWTESPCTMVHKNDILLSCKGTVGKTVILKLDEAHIARQIMGITPINMDLSFVRYLIINNVSNLSKQAKSMIPGIDRKNVLNLLVPLPPLEEQKRIVSKIEELLPLCDNLKR